MTVRELIKQLQAQPQDKLVIVDAYETGFTELKDAKLIQVERCEPGNYHGEFDFLYDGPAVDAVYLK